MLPPSTTDRTDERGQNLRGPMEGRPETAGLGSLEERVDLRNNLETRGRYILRAQGYLKRLSVDTEVGLRHKGKLAGGQETASRGGGSGGGNTIGVGPPPSPGNLAPDQGVVQAYSQA